MNILRFNSKIFWLSPREPAVSTSSGNFHTHVSTAGSDFATNSWPSSTESVLLPNGVVNSPVLLSTTSGTSPRSWECARSTVLSVPRLSRPAWAAVWNHVARLVEVFSSTSRNRQYHYIVEFLFWNFLNRDVSNHLKERCRKEKNERKVNGWLFKRTFESD